MNIYRYGMRLRRGSKFSRKNLPRLWLQINKKELKEFNGMCLDLAYLVGSWLGEKKIVYSHIMVEPIDFNTLVAEYPDNKFIWTYHVVLMINGFVHDPWLSVPLPVKDYISRIFPNQKVELEYRKTVDGDVSSVETRYNHKVLHKGRIR